MFGGKNFPLRVFFKILSRTWPPALPGVPPTHRASLAAPAHLRLGPGVDVDAGQAAGAAQSPTVRGRHLRPEQEAVTAGGGGGGAAPVQELLAAVGDGQRVAPLAAPGETTDWPGLPSLHHLQSINDKSFAAKLESCRDQLKYCNHHQPFTHSVSQSVSIK